MMKLKNTQTLSPIREPMKSVIASVTIKMIAPDSLKGPVTGST